MLNTKPELEKNGFQEIETDLSQIKSFLENCLMSNSLEDRNREFFREIAALKGKSVQETLQEMMAGVQNYLTAVEISIQYKNNDPDMPIDVNLLADKLQKLAQGIESCWDLFSLESRQFFMNLSYDFRLKSDKFKGGSGLIIKLKLLWPSLRQGKNLFKTYRESYFLIPNAVDRAIQLRKSKSTLLLYSTGQELLRQGREIDKKSSLLSTATHFGKTPEEQIEKNKPLREWVQARMREIEKRREERGKLI